MTLLVLTLSWSLLFFNRFLLHLCIGGHYSCHSGQGKVEGKLRGVGALLLTCGCPRQAPLATELSFWSAVVWFCFYALQKLCPVPNRNTLCVTGNATTSPIMLPFLIFFF